LCKTQIGHNQGMRKIPLTIPEIAFIAATRGALGLGAGLLLSGKLSESRRRAVGVSLLAIGIATTIPAARTLFGHTKDGDHWSPDTNL
jgi:hypothetical protein